MLRNRLRRVLALLGVAAAFSALAQAPAYPNQPIKFVVPAGPGGPTDIAGRIVANALAEELRQPVVIENKTGAGLVVGTTYLSKAKPDGYTIGIGGASSHAIPPGLYRNLGYDAEKDFVPIGLLFTTPMVLVVSPALPVRNLRELIAYARANPGKVNYASGGNGTLSHLSAESLKAAARIDLVHVPYRGSAPANTDLQSGQVQLMFQSLHLAMPFITAGKLVPLGVASAQRTPMMPDLPTLSEAGLPGFEIREWFALFAPAGTPPEVVARLNAAIVKDLRSPQSQQRFAAAGLIPTPSTPEEAARTAREERRAWARVISEAKVQID
jgi:tripartite-type tricarboxylate transporter receptor subunit TctC